VHHPWPYFQAKNRQGTESRALLRRASFGSRPVSSGCRDFRMAFRSVRTLSDGAGGFLPGVPLGCLGMRGPRSRSEAPALRGRLAAGRAGAA
jgi:hypothetical protein